MKILFVIKKMDDAPGGAERVLATISAGLAARGHEVVLVSFDREGGQSFYPLPPLVRRVRLGIGDSSRRTTVWDAVCRMIALRHIVGDEKPDIVVAFMHSMFVPTAFAFTGMRVPLIASEHIVAEHYKSRLGEFVLTLAAMRLAQRTTVLSEAARNSYPAFVRARMSVVPNPVAPVSRVADPAGSNTATKIILNVGRLAAQKDQAILIEAFALLATRHPRWGLRIFGEGPLRPALEQRVRRLGLEGRVSLPGVVRNIGAEYAAAHIFALTSHYESFGMVTAEALLHGLPAVGFADCLGTNELITDGVNGILVQTRTATDLAAALERLISAPEVRAAYGLAAQQGLHAFEPDQITTLWEDLLTSVSETQSS